LYCQTASDFSTHFHKANFPTVKIYSSFLQRRNSDKHTLNIIQHNYCNRKGTAGMHQQLLHISESKARGIHPPKGRARCYAADGDGKHCCSARHIYISTLSIDRDWIGTKFPLLSFSSPSERMNASQQHRKRMMFLRFDKGCGTL
jgi:hypothetical protein